MKNFTTLASASSLYERLGYLILNIIRGRSRALAYIVGGATRSLDCKPRVGVFGRFWDIPSQRHRGWRVRQVMRVRGVTVNAWSSSVDTLRDDLANSGVIQRNNGVKRDQ